MIVSILVALAFGFLAYIVFSLIIFTRHYAQVIGLVVAILVFLSRIGAIQ